MSEKIPILVVLGIDVDGKPHASRFEDRDAPFVERAAEVMGFQVVRVSPDHPLHAIADELPLGKIFASGRAFVPFVGRLMFDKLAAVDQGGGTVKIGRFPNGCGLTAANDEIEAVNRSSIFMNQGLSVDFRFE